MEDKIFICQSCQVRLKKVKDFKGLGFYWGLESFKELKLKFFRVFNKKPLKKIVLTSCLGYCPEEKISFQETKNGVLQKEQAYSFDLDRENIFKLFFR